MCDIGEIVRTVVLEPIYETESVPEPKLVESTDVVQEELVSAK